MSKKLHISCNTSPACLEIFIGFNFCVVKEVIKKSVLAKCKIKKETSTGNSYLFANLVHVFKSATVVVGRTLLLLFTIAFNITTIQISESK